MASDLVGSVFHKIYHTKFCWLQDELGSHGGYADRRVKSKPTWWEPNSSTCSILRMLKKLKMRGPYSGGRGIVRENLLSWKKIRFYVSLSACNWKGLFSSKCHAQMDKLHMKNSTVATCNVLVFQMHFVSSLLYILCISLFIFHATAVKRLFKTQLTAFSLQMLRDIFTSTS